MSIKAVKLTCSCGKEYIGFQERHVMYCCPFCKSTGIDWEEHYTRWMGEVKDTEYFEPPYFEDEEEYHSALLSFLNNSDELYTLYKDKGVLYIVKQK
jgi:hypothetical protein